MELVLHESDRTQIGLIEGIDSILWNERFDKPGDFEIYTNVTSEFLETFQIGRYLRNNTVGSNSWMIIEGREIVTDFDVGNKLIVTGRSLESLLDRRLIIPQLLIDSTLAVAISDLINDNVITATDSLRDVSEFRYIEVSGGVFDTAVETQFDDQDTLLDAVTSLCNQHDIGFSIEYNLTLDKFDITLNAGDDRSYAQSNNAFVIFSPEFDNLSSSRYKESLRAFKTFCLTKGDPSDGPATKVESFLGSPTISGLSRREVFLDQTNLSEYVGDTEVKIPTADYEAQLEQKGDLLLKDLNVTSGFDGEVEATKMFTYGVDFNIGDIVQFADEYGNKGTAKVVEFIINSSLSGFSTHPIFYMLD